MTTTNPERRIGGSEDVSEVYERYGKPDFLASVVGMFAGLGTLVFLGALIAAGAGGIDYQLNMLNDQGALDEASVVGLIVAAVVVFASFLVGGFAAGRMARYQGGMNGFGAGLWMILLVAIFAALGAWVGAEYNAFNRIDLPNWFAQVDVDDLTTMAIVASLVLVAATLAGGYVGGRLGETYHTKVDAALIAAARKEG
jgi:uncharacterized membrane protein